MDLEVQKRVHMGWHAKGWISKMLVHNCGLQKPWCVKLWPAQGLVGQWVGGLGKAKGRTTSQMPEDRGQMQKQQLPCLFVRYSGDRPVAVQVRQRGPLVARNSQHSIRHIHDTSC